MATPTEYPLRTIFMGTPAFAAVILKALIDSPLVTMVGVFTQPNRVAGRGRQLRSSPVAQLALFQDIPVFQPERLCTTEQQQWVADLAPDICLVAAYGLILPQAVLDIPRYGCINVHASLLPRYRGATPIQRAILVGDSTTGITIIQMNAQLDTGNILLQHPLAISLDDTAQTLYDKLAILGARLLLDVLDQLVTGTLHAIPQNHSQASYAPKLRKEEGLVQWNQPALKVHNHIRGLYPWPGAWFLWKRYNSKLLRLTLQPGRIGSPVDKPIPSGHIQGLIDEHLAISCRDRWYLVSSLTPEGRTTMNARSFYNGYFLIGRSIPPRYS